MVELSSKSVAVWYSFPSDWWKNKVLKYLRDCGMENKRGATTLAINAIDAWIGAHPDGIASSNNELSVLARKAADKLKGITS